MNREELKKITTVGFHFHHPIDSAIAVKLLALDEWLYLKSIGE